MIQRRAAFALIAVSLLGTWIGAQARVFTTGTPEELERARTLARAHLTTVARAMSVDAADLTIVNAQVDQLSMAHVRVRQSYRGIPVIGAEAIVHLRATGDVSGETNNLLSGIMVDTQPRIPARDAVATAVEGSGCARCTAAPPTPDLAIVRREKTDHLVYRVQLRGTDGSRPTLPVVYVDAHDGRIVQQYDNLQTGGITPAR